MKLEPKQLRSLKMKLFIEGHGSKTKLSTELGCKPSQVTYILNTGLVSKRLESGIINYLNSKP
jgi:hypothetical protein